MDLEVLTSKVQKKFLESVLGASSFRGENTLILRVEDILPICRFLHDDPELSYDYLTDLCGVDFYPSEPRFEVIYHLCAMKTRSRLRLKTSLPGTAPHLTSVVSVWKGADWMEREVFDMFGIKFDGHPDLRRILLTPDWEGYPLRKDYPLRG
ncbi:MAG: NADH-quinone oxidoreductase subunit C [Deltaproteobacteria bacterium]|nr:NADH-quinone oxidoreductase subunit C [Deltaproteobacteria bacterium]